MNRTKRVCSFYCPALVFMAATIGGIGARAADEPAEAGDKLAAPLVGSWRLDAERTRAELRDDADEQVMEMLDGGRLGLALKIEEDGGLILTIEFDDHKSEARGTWEVVEQQGDELVLRWIIDRRTQRELRFMPLTEGGLRFDAPGAKSPLVLKRVPGEKPAAESR